MHSVSIRDLAEIIILSLLFGAVQGGLLIGFIFQRKLLQEKNESKEPEKEPEKFKTNVKEIPEVTSAIANSSRSLTSDPLAKPDPSKYVHQYDYSEDYTLYTGVYL